MRAVLYARVSGDDRQTATSGIDDQLDKCREYANQKGYKIVGEFNEDADKHTSGADWLPEIKNILLLADQHYFDVLIVKDISRLARSRKKHIGIESQLEYLGIGIEYVEGRYEDSPQGRLQKGIVAEFVEFDRELINLRLQNGRINSIKKKKNVTLAGSHSIFGYDLVTKDDRRQLIINELEAQIVRLIFDLYGRKGYSLSAIATYLDSHNIARGGQGATHKKSRKTKGWAATTVRHIIKNETYIGNWYYGKSQFVKDPVTDKRKSIPRPRSEWYLVEVPPIVDRELFDLAQRRLKENKRQKDKSRKHFYLLGGMVECGGCGTGMTGTTKKYNGKQYAYYLCNARNNPRYEFKCDNGTFKIGDIDAAVWGWVKSVLTSPEKLNESLELHQEKQKAHLQPLIRMVEANEAKLESVKEQKERLIKSYAEGVLSLDDIAQNKVAIDKEIEDLTRAIASFKAELNPKLLSPAEIQSIRQWTKKIKLGADVITKYSPEKVRGILQQLQTSVKLGREGKVIWAKVRCVLGEKTLYSNGNCNELQLKPLEIEKHLIINPIV